MCNDLFLSRRKQVQALALYIVYVEQELNTMIDSQILAREMQVCYESAFTEGQQLEEAIDFYQII